MSGQVDQLIRLLTSRPNISLIEAMDVSGMTAEDILGVIGYEMLHPSFKPLVYNGTLKLHQIWGLSRLGDVEAQAVFWTNYGHLEVNEFHRVILQVKKVLDEIRFVKNYGTSAQTLVEMNEVTQEEAKTIVLGFFNAYPNLKQIFKSEFPNADL